MSIQDQTSQDQQPTRESSHSSDQGVDLLNGRYRVITELGRGSQGRALLAEMTEAVGELEVGGRVVLKELDFGHIDHLKVLELFEREARVLRSINHPGVPAYIDEFHESRADSTLTRYFLAQEFIAGENLRDLLVRGRLFDEKEVRRIMAGILKILEYLHTQTPPIIHRDIKPSNIILRADNGEPVLVDFGGVHQQIVAQSASSTIVGTSGYMPIEQLMGRPSAPSDLYALGATAVYLLSRTSPDQMLDDQMNLAFEDAVHISAPFLNYLKRLLAPAATDRFQSASEALSFLDDPARLPPDVPRVVPGTLSTRSAGEVIPAPIRFEWDQGEKNALISRLNERMIRLSGRDLARIDLRTRHYTPRGRLPITYRTPRPDHPVSTIKRSDYQLVIKLESRLKSVLNALIPTLPVWSAFMLVTGILAASLALLGYLDGIDQIFVMISTALWLLGAVILIAHTPWRTWKNLPFYFSPRLVIRYVHHRPKLQYLKRGSSPEDSELADIFREEIEEVAIIYAQRDKSSPYPQPREKTRRAIRRAEKRARAQRDADESEVLAAIYRMEIRTRTGESVVLGEELPLEEQFYLMGEVADFIGLELEPARSKIDADSAPDSI